VHRDLLEYYRFGTGNDMSHMNQIKMNTRITANGIAN
jgi:hypothetical protein